MPDLEIFHLWSYLSSQQTRPQKHRFHCCPPLHCRYQGSWRWKVQRKERWSCWQRGLPLPCLPQESQASRTDLAPTQPHIMQSRPRFLCCRSGHCARLSAGTAFWAPWVWIWSAPPSAERRVASAAWQSGPERLSSPDQQCRVQHEQLEVCGSPPPSSMLTFVKKELSSSDSHWSCCRLTIQHKYHRYAFSLVIIGLIHTQHKPRLTRGGWCLDNIQVKRWLLCPHIRIPWANPPPIQWQSTYVNRAWDTCFSFG